MADPMPHPTFRVLYFARQKTKKAENVFRGKYQAGANRIKGQALHLNGKPRKIFFSDLCLCSRINLSKSDPYLPQTKKANALSFPCLIFTLEKLGNYKRKTH